LWKGRVQIGEGDDAVAVGTAMEKREEAVFAPGDQGDHVEPVGLRGRHFDQTWALARL
jgi:hypothetical protein